MPKRKKTKAAKKKKAASKTKKKAAKKGKTTVKKSSKKSSSKKSSSKKAAKKKAVKKAGKKAAKKKKTTSAKSAKTGAAKGKTKKKAAAAAKTAKKARTSKTKKKETATNSRAVDRLRAVRGTGTVPEEAGKIPPLSQRISTKDLRQIKNALLERRRQLIGSIGAFESEYLGTSENRTTTGGDEADQAASAMVADLNLRLAESETQELKDIQDALLKIQDGTYGICEVTGKPIDVRRLLARPSARLSIEAQRDLEAQKLYFDERVGWVMQDEYGSF